MKAVLFSFCLKTNPGSILFTDHYNLSLLHLQIYRRNVWLRLLKRSDLRCFDGIYLARNKRVCSKHFDDEMFANYMKNRLTERALPVNVEEFEFALLKSRSSPQEISNSRDNVVNFEASTLDESNSFKVIKSIILGARR